jgi:protocatechuate 3,4-dioxygenase beta subunit
MNFEPVESDVYPRVVYPPYKSTIARGPKQAALRVRASLPAVRTIPATRALLGRNDADLTVHGKSAPLGEKIIVTGRVTDEDGRPVRDSLLEVWQCNAAGRYWHSKDQHDAPLDPNFYGLGKMLTDSDGRYRFVTIKPGPYPWGNHEKAWRPAHIHFSLFGNAYAQRLVTQMYWANDPLFEHDPIFQSVPDAAARERLCARLDMEVTDGSNALGYVWNIVLRGRDATPMGL